MSEKFVQKQDPIGEQEMSFDVLMAMYWRRHEALNTMFASAEQEQKVDEMIDSLTSSREDAYALSREKDFAGRIAENNAYETGFKDAVHLMRLLQNL